MNKLLLLPLIIALTGCTIAAKKQAPAKVGDACLSCWFVGPEQDPAKRIVHKTIGEVEYIRADQMPKFDK